MTRTSRFAAIGLAALALAACGSLPWHSSVNVPACDTASPAQGCPNPSPANPGRGGAFLGSQDVAWDVPAGCRAGFGREPSAPANRERPDDPYPADNRLPSDDLRRFCDGAPENRDTDFVGVALSGGGSRAAVFSAQVLLELQRHGLLDHADVVSSVSGGSIATGLYAISEDRPGDAPVLTLPDAGRPLWSPEPAAEAALFDLLTTDFRTRHILSWFRPDTFFKYWFTHYDRGDIMAETFARALFAGGGGNGPGLRMRDINPARPFILLNAAHTGPSPFMDPDQPWLPTDGIASFECSVEGGFTPERMDNALNFAFTRERLGCLNSDFADYPLAYAVTASAAHPFFLPYITLRDHFFPAQAPRYSHIFDGGASDNLGLAGLAAPLRLSTGKGRPPHRILIVQVSSGRGFHGTSQADADPRHGFDFVLDTNALVGLETLFFAGYDRIERLTDGLLCDAVKSARRDQLARVRATGTEPEVRGVLEKLLLVDPACLVVNGPNLAGANRAFEQSPVPLLSPIRFADREIERADALARRIPAGHREKIALTDVYCLDPALSAGSAMSIDPGRLAAHEACMRNRGREIWARVRSISTDFRVARRDTQCLRAAARLATFMAMQRLCLGEQTRAAFGDLACPQFRADAFAPDRDGCLDAASAAQAP